MTARAGADEEGRTTSAEKKSNLIAYEPAPDAPEPWWPVDERTGKPPGWFQLLVFAASQVFKELFDPVIEARHNGYKADAKHPTDMNPDNLSARAVDPTGNYILTTRCRTGRSAWARRS